MSTNFGHVGVCWTVRYRQLISSLCTALALGCMVGVSLAQGSATCADLPNAWDVPNPNLQPINTPGAGKPTDVNSKAIKAALAKKEQYLKCDSSLLTPLGLLSASPVQVFDKRVAASVKEKNDLVNVAKAVYIVQLSSKGIIAAADPGVDSLWIKAQYGAWCAANDPDGTKKLQLPKMKSIVQSVAELDAMAIPLGWARVQKVDGERLPNSCDDSLRALVKRANAAK